MALFQITQPTLKEVTEITFGDAKIKERQDLQRYLREQIHVLDSRSMVIAEEYEDWADSSRRIDLLCLDVDGYIVVVELKITPDGGHMELQALRYAAMVSNMTFKDIVAAHAKFKSKVSPDIETSETVIKEFLSRGDGSKDDFPRGVRIILAAADFSKEITTTVLWLLDQDIDIRCIRMQPCRMDDETLLLDVQQVIPLPNAEDFQVKIGARKQAERNIQSERHELRLKFWEGLLDLARGKTNVHANRKPTSDSWISGGIGKTGFSLTYVVRRNDSQVDLWIAHGSGQTAKNKAAFKALESQKEAIQSDFGDALEWQELPEGDGCRIRFVISGGYQSAQDQWPSIQEKLVDAMLRLESAVRSRVMQLVY